MLRGVRHLWVRRRRWMICVAGRERRGRATDNYSNKGCVLQTAVVEKRMKEEYVERGCCVRKDRSHCPNSKGWHSSTLPSDSSRHLTTAAVGTSEVDQT